MDVQLQKFATDDAKISWRKIVNHGYYRSSVVKPLQTNVLRQVRRPVVWGTIWLIVSIIIDSQWLNIVNDGWNKRHDDAWKAIDAIASSITLFAGITLVMAILYIIIALSLRSNTRQRGPWRKSVPRPVTYSIRVRSTLSGEVEATVERQGPKMTDAGLTYNSSPAATFSLGSRDDAVAVIAEYATILEQCTSLGEEARERWRKSMQDVYVQEQALEHYHQQHPIQSLSVMHHDQLGNHLKAYAQTRKSTAVS